MRAVAEAMSWCRSGTSGEQEQYVGHFGHLVDMCTSWPGYPCRVAKIVYLHSRSPASCRSLDILAASLPYKPLLSVILYGQTRNIQGGGSYKQAANGALTLTVHLRSRGAQYTNISHRRAFLNVLPPFCLSIPLFRHTSTLSGVHERSLKCFRDAIPAAFREAFGEPELGPLPETAGCTMQAPPPQPPASPNLSAAEHVRARKGSGKCKSRKQPWWDARTGGSSATACASRRSSLTPLLVRTHRVSMFSSLQS